MENMCALKKNLSEPLTPRLDNNELHNRRKPHETHDNDELLHVILHTNTSRV